MMGADLTLACVPSAIDPNERHTHFELLRKLFGERLRERRELPNGYEFHFDSEDIGDLMHFVSKERLCCPFPAFDLSLAPNEGAVSLKMTGPPGTRAFLDAELRPTRL